MGWEQTSYGCRIQLEIKLTNRFKPDVALHVNPVPGCPLCILDGTAPKALANLHTERYAGASYPILIERYGELLEGSGIKIDVRMLSEHFSKHFVMQRV